jgi:hypothetical protein
MKTFVDALDRLPIEERARVRSAVADSVWTDIERSGSLTWLPFEVNVQCTHAVAQTLDPTRTHEFFRGLLVATTRTPVLRGLAEAVLRKLGPDPGASLFWVSRGFELLFKDCGSWRVLDRRRTSADLMVNGLPLSVVRDRVWIESAASSLSGLYPLARLRGTTTIREIDSGTGRVIFRLIWQLDVADVDDREGGS